MNDVHERQEHMEHTRKSPQSGRRWIDIASAPLLPVALESGVRRHFLPCGVEGSFGHRLRTMGTSWF